MKPKANYMVTDQLIHGEGSKEKPSSPYETPNSLITRTTGKVLFLMSDGEVHGLYDQDKPLKSVYFNNVPVMNPDETLNFTRVSVMERYGLPDQAAISGFTAISASYNVATKVTTSVPVTYTTTTSDVDAVRCTIRHNALFEQTDKGDINATEVSYSFWHRIGSGTWTEVASSTVNDKTNAAADLDVTIPRPLDPGVWSVQVRRVTADNSSSSKGNDIFFQTATELKYDERTYNDRALLGLSVTSDTAGADYPTVSFDYVGVKIKVPSNYDPVTRIYSGAWDGLFDSTLQVSDNPAWVLYDMLTNERHGLGLSEADIDAYSFYDAAVYNDALVPALVDGEISGTEPRFTFNHQYMNQESPWDLVQNLAATFNSVVYTAGNLVRLVQDRPTSVSHIVSNSTVVTGMFTYMSSPKSGRSTACVVHWRNPDENWLAVPAYYEDTAAVARYGYNLTEYEGIGISSEGQAMRYAKNIVETSVSNGTSCTFEVGFKHADILPGDIIKIMDSDYAEVIGEARVLSFTSNTLTLDKDVPVTSGNAFDVLGADGVTILTRTISVTSSGNVVTFTGSALDIVVGATVIFTGAVAPRLFKVLNVKEMEYGKWSVGCSLYDPTKFGRVDSTPVGVAPVYQLSTLEVSAPRNMAFKESGVNEAGLIRKVLLVTWNRPLTGVPVEYKARWRRSGGAWTVIDTTSTSFEITPAADGEYEVEVRGKSSQNIYGPILRGNYVITGAGGGSSDLFAVTSLEVFNGISTSGFGTNDLTVIFTNPATNTVDRGTIRDFEVRILTVADEVVRVFYVPAVAVNETQTATYTYDQNLTDGGPRREFKVAVRARDTSNNLSAATVLTVQNPAPAALTGLNYTPGTASANISWNLPEDEDYYGIVVHRSTDNDFTPDASTLLADVDASYYTDTTAVIGNTYYYKVAAYDTYGADVADLNFATQTTGASTPPDGIPEVSELPDPDGYTGPKIVFLETDGQLYSYIDGAWEPTIPPVTDVIDGSITIAKFASGLRPVEIVGSLPGSGNVEGRMVYLTTDDKLYRYTGGAWTAAVASSDISGQLTNAQIADLAASKLTGTIDVARIADGTISGTKFASGIKPIEVFATLPVTGLVEGRMVYLTTDDKLYRYTGSAWVSTIPAADVTGQLTNDQIAAIAAAKVTGTLTNSQIADLATTKLTGTITQAQIADGAINTAKFASTIKPIEVLSSLPGSGNVEGRMVYLTTDDKLYRYTGSSWTAAVASADISGQLTNAQIAALDAAKLTGSITTTQIADDAITTPKILTGAVVTDHITANTLLGDRIQVNTLSGDRIVANTVQGNRIVAGTLDADRIVANSITSGQIATGAISADEVAAGAITTNKLFVTAGAALNADPGTRDITAWGSLTGTSIATDNTSPVGSNVIEITGSSVRAMSELIPIDAAKNYNLRMFAKQQSGSATCYLVVQFFDGNGTIIPGTGNAVGWPAASSFHYFGLYGQQPPATYTEYQISFGPNETAKIPSGAKSVRVGPWGNYSGASTQRFAGVRLLLKQDANLIVDGAITANKILAGAVTAGKIASNAITANEIASGTITGAMIKGTTITAANIVGGTITGEKIAGLTITGEKIAGTTITGGHIIAGSINGDRISANSIEAGQINSGAITVDELASNAVTSVKIAADAVTAVKIKAGEINTNHMTAGTIDANRLLAGSITTNLMTANTINGDRIVGNTLHGDKITGNTITAGKIQAGAIGADQIAAGAITAEKLRIAAKSLNMDPTFAAGSNLWYGFGSRVPKASAANGNAPGDFISTFTQRDNYCTVFYPCVPGEQYRLSCYVWRGGIQDVGMLVAYGATQSGGNGAVVGTPVSTNYVWTLNTGVWTVPAGVNYFAFGPWQPSVNASSNNWWTDFSVEKVNDGQLIVDGAITGTKIAALTITGANIVGDSIAGGKITSGSLHADRITAGTIKTDRIEIGSVGTSVTAKTDFTTIYSGAAVTGASGTLNGPTLSCTGRPVQVGFTGSIRYIVNSTAARFYKGRIEAALVNTATGVPIAGLPIGFYSVDERAVSLNTVFHIPMVANGVYSNVPVGNYQLRVTCYGDCKDGNNNYIASITNLFLGGDFFIQEIKV